MRVTVPIQSLGRPIPGQPPSVVLALAHCTPPHMLLSFVRRLSRLLLSQSLPPLLGSDFTLLKMSGSLLIVFFWSQGISPLAVNIFF